mmetsp:Transcript_14610/g.20297  ORF Transcript_14610/g.20297 Transcript_14610/m.20297 type:complete len:88 (-) Transcript_14610:107-370(-)
MYALMTPAILFILITRQELRQKYGIKDDTCCGCDTCTTGMADYFSVCCCGPCVVAQMDRTEFGWKGKDVPDACCNDEGCWESFKEPV